MLNRHARGFFTALFTPLARWLLKLGVSPDAITIVGTAGVVIGALVFYPLGQLFWGTVFITAFIFSDVIDGIMARMQKGGGPENLRQFRLLPRHLILGSVRTLPRRSTDGKERVSLLHALGALQGSGTRLERDHNPPLRCPRYYRRQRERDGDNAGQCDGPDGVMP